MTIQNKPYLIVPFLIEQPTWGGDYICKKKGWLHKKGLDGKKIGQSYELYDRSQLAITITTTDDPHFSPEVTEVLPISHFLEGRPFPLIKFTQAKGNSFQLHIKPEITDERWKQKAESWYYFEDGKITFGIRKGIDINHYKQTCIGINNEMKILSEKVIKNTLTIDQAKERAHAYIMKMNPWQFVNVCEVKKGDIVDLSGGGLHHSWEEDMEHHPHGNILYEVQQDVMDPICTIRSFDQGKFKDDGTIREIHIEDYFKYLDLDEKRNTLTIERSSDGVLFNTPFYCLKKLDVSQDVSLESSSSFHHIFVQEGKVIITDSNRNSVQVTEGHSCFVPKDIHYTIHAADPSELLLTYLR